MEESRQRMRKINSAIEKQFECAPSVVAWKRMTDLLSEFIFIASQLHDEHLHRSRIFQKALGYLKTPPKRVPAGHLVNDEEWLLINYYTDSEVDQMNLGYSRLAHRLGEWAAVMGGDLQIGPGGPGRPFSSVAWEFWLAYERNEMSVFKSFNGTAMFRNHPFRWLEEQGRLKLESPSVQKESLEPMVDDYEVYREETLRCLRRTAVATEMIAGDAVAEGQARKRVGTPGEVSQENESIRRTRANDGKGLRGFIVAVLNNRQWQFSDGYGTDERSIRRCYSRCYELMHPTRRHRGA